MEFYPTPVDSSRREIFVCTFRFVVAFSVSRQIDFLSVRTGCPIQLYLRASTSVSCFDWFLVLGFSLPVAQLFMTVIGDILRRGVGNLASNECVNWQRKMIPEGVSFQRSRHPLLSHPSLDPRLVHKYTIQCHAT